LLSNALKFTPEGGIVDVRLKSSLSGVEFSVTDSGVGMAPDILPRVFDRFRQADSSSSRTQGGLGLGLAIVRHMVELHGGSVSAHSPGLGMGATFIVHLPAIKEAALADLDANLGAVLTLPAKPGLDSGGPDEGVSRLDGVTVLLVDDQPDARRFLEVTLQRCGARVIAVASASEAFESIQNDRPDLMLSDIGMPDEDGFSLIRRVRKLTPKKGGVTPAVALTAFAGAEDRSAVLRAGFQAHLPKPADLAQLIAVIAELGSGTL